MSGPIQMRLPLRPDCEVNFLITHQVWPVRLTCKSLQIAPSAVLPTHEKGAIGPRDEIGAFPGRLRSVEDNLQFWTDCDAYQCGLWGVISRNARHYPIPMSRHEGMQSNSIHLRLPPTAVANSFLFPSSRLAEREIEAVSAAQGM